MQIGNYEMSGTGAQLKATGLMMALAATEIAAGLPLLVLIASGSGCNGSVSWSSNTINRASNTVIVMVIKSKTNTKSLLRQGNYNSAVSSVKGLPNDTDQKKAALGFKIDNHDAVIVKEVPYSVEEGTPLREDAETILGRQLTQAEILDGFELNDLVGKPCQVVVVHRPGAGGKPVAVVGIVLPSAQPQVQTVTA